MSHNFKRPKQHPALGNARAKIARWGRNIQNQEHLDSILAQMPAAVRAAAVEQFRPYLRFTPEVRIAESSLDKPE